MHSNDMWLEWVKELQSIAQCALAYCRDPYDIERFRRVREISVGMMAELTRLPTEAVRAVFASENGYQTPKLDTRAAVIRDKKLLLVQERDGKWSLPGGWCDADQSIGENTVKEVREEAGMEVKPLRLIALFDRNRHLAPRTICEITSVFVLCEYVSGAFAENLETLDSRFFDRSELPGLPLSTGKNSLEQLNMCFDAADDAHWQVVFD